MSLRIVSTSLAGRVGETIPCVADRVTIGRADDCTVVLADTSVSRHHAFVERTATGFRVVDTGSANGVFLGEERVGEAPLAHGATFRVGSTVFEFVAPPPEIEERTIVSAPPREFRVRIVAAKAADAVGKEFTVSGAATIGRSDECTIALRDGSASRSHARVEVCGDGAYRLVDNASANGVWLDDRRVTEEII